MWIYHIHWWTLGCFHFSATMNNAVMMVSIQVFVQMCIFISPSYIPVHQRGIAGSYGNSMFKMLRHCQPVFQRAISHSHQQYRRVPVYPHPHQHLLLCFHFFFILVLWLIWNFEGIWGSGEMTYSRNGHWRAWGIGGTELPVAPLASWLWLLPGHLLSWLLQSFHWAYGPQITSLSTEAQIRSDQSLSCVRLFSTPWIAARQASLSITNSPSSQWCHPAISSSVIPFSSCPQSLPAWESSPVSQLFAWGGQSTGVSALASFLPKKS